MTSTSAPVSHSVSSSFYFYPIVGPSSHRYEFIEVERGNVICKYWNTEMQEVVKTYRLSVDILGLIPPIYKPLISSSLQAAHWLVRRGYHLVRLSGNTLTFDVRSKKEIVGSRLFQSITVYNKGRKKGFSTMRAVMLKDKTLVQVSRSGGAILLYHNIFTQNGECFPYTIPLSYDCETRLYNRATITTRPVTFDKYTIEVRDVNGELCVEDKVKQQFTHFKQLEIFEPGENNPKKSANSKEKDPIEVSRNGKILLKKDAVVLKSRFWSKRLSPQSQRENKLKSYFFITPPSVSYSADSLIHLSSGDIMWRESEFLSDCVNYTLCVWNRAREEIAHRLKLPRVEFSQYCDPDEKKKPRRFFLTEIDKGVILYAWNGQETRNFWICGTVGIWDYKNSISSSLRVISNLYFFNEYKIKEVSSHVVLYNSKELPIAKINLSQLSQGITDIFSERPTASLCLDSTTSVFGFFDGSVCVWDLNTLSTIDSFKVFNSKVESLSWLTNDCIYAETDFEFAILSKTKAVPLFHATRGIVCKPQLSSSHRVLRSESTEIDLQQLETYIESVVQRYLDESGLPSSNLSPDTLPVEQVEEIESLIQRAIHEQLTFELEENIAFVLKDQVNQALRSELEEVSKKVDLIETRLQKHDQKAQKKAEEIESKRSLIQGPEPVKIFYQTVEREFGSKLFGAMVLTSGLVGRAHKKLDYLAEGAGVFTKDLIYALAFFGALPSFGATLLVAEGAAATAQVAVEGAGKKAISQRVQKEAMHVNMTMGNFKHAMEIAELVARRLTERRKDEVKQLSAKEAHQSASNAVSYMYNFIASGFFDIELEKRGLDKKSDSNLLDEKVELLVELVDQKAMKGRRRKFRIFGEKKGLVFPKPLSQTQPKSDEKMHELHILNRTEVDELAALKAELRQLREEVHQLKKRKEPPKTRPKSESVEEMRELHALNRTKVGDLAALKAELRQLREEVHQLKKGKELE